MEMYIGFAILCFLDAGYSLLIKENICVVVYMLLGIVCIASAIGLKPPK